MIATATAPKSNVLGIQVLRALAAVAVVVHHSIRAYTINLPDRLAAIPKSIRTAFNRMTTGRPGAAHLGLPFDVQKQTLDEADVWAESDLGTFPARRTGPDPAAVSRAAELAQVGRVLCWHVDTFPPPGGSFTPRDQGLKTESFMSQASHRLGQE